MRRCRQQEREWGTMGSVLVGGRPPHACDAVLIGNTIVIAIESRCLRTAVGSHSHRHCAGVA